MSHEIKDSNGTPIPDRVIEHVQKLYGDAAAQVATSIITSGKGFGYATMESDGETCGIVVVALDTPNARTLLELLRKMDTTEARDS